MKEKWGCPNHPNIHMQKFQYNILKGYICPKCGNRPTLLEMTSIEANE